MASETSAPERAGVGCRARSWLTAVAIAAAVAGCGGDVADPGAGLVLPETPWFWRSVLADPHADEAPAELHWLRLPPIDPTTVPVARRTTPGRDAPITPGGPQGDGPQGGEVPATPTSSESEPSPLERLEHLRSLAREGPDRALATLLHALRDEETGVAIGAAHLLGTLGSRAAIPRLLKGIGPHPVDFDPDRNLRLAEASALARLGNPAGLPLILTALAEGTDLEIDEADLPWTRTTRNAFTQELALVGLRALAGTDFGFHPSAPVAERERAVREARRWWDERRIALWAASGPLESDGLTARVGRLVANLGAYQLRQIDGARFTLDHLGPGVLPFLVDGVADEDGYVRVHSLEILERLCDKVDEKTLGRIAIVASDPLIADTDPAVAAQAARTCGAARVVDPLIVALEQRTDVAVLVAIFDAFGAARRPAGLQALERFERAPPAGVDVDQPDLRAAIEGARLRLDPDADPSRLVALLADEDASVAFAALERLVALTGDDFGLDPTASRGDREAALARARAALDRL